jgi:hypothetical protein
VNSKTVNTIFGVFDEAQAKKFQKAYEANKDKESFVFKVSTGEEHPILVDLAKYMIEFLKNEKLL